MVLDIKPAVGDKVGWGAEKGVGYSVGSDVGIVNTLCDIIIIEGNGVGNSVGFGVGIGGGLGVGSSERIDHSI